MAILLTGASGIVGAELVRSLLREAPEAPLYLLLRGTAIDIEAKVRWLRHFADAPDPARLRVIRGDITLPALGLSMSDRARVTDDVDAILHAAACTSFAQTKESACTNNVLGTRHVLDLARSLHGPVRVGLVSSAFAAGGRAGVIEEAPHADLEGSFDNEYERSKALAEHEARTSGLPVAIYRVGIVLGRRGDGKIARMNDAAYVIIRLVHEGLISMFPGERGQLLDLVPVDFVADAITDLFVHRFRESCVYHVCAGRKRALSVQDFFTTLVATMRDLDPRFRKLGYPAPSAVAPATFRRFLQTVELVANTRLRAVVRQIETFTRPLEFPKIFDTTNLDRDLAGSGVELEGIERWLPRVLAHAIETGFKAPTWRTHAP